MASGPPSGPRLKIMRFYTLPGGAIQFIHRGLPPMEVPGYEVDPGDPYIFHPVVAPCVHRVPLKITTPCCPEGKEIRFCDKFKYYNVLSSQCMDCIRLGNQT